MKWRVGDVTVTRVVEVEFTGGTDFLIPAATPDAVRELGWLRPHFATDAGELRWNVQAFVVETPARRVLVDTCLGNDKRGRPIPAWNDLQTRFLEDLSAAGYPPESIDTVLCTHLHVDHVGWNTRLAGGRWVPTFPHARYLMGRAEYAYWTTQKEWPVMDLILADSVKPVWDAGLVDLVETDAQLCGELRLMPTPGHTPGHVSVRVSSRGEAAVISGDVMHHPCQMARPDWTSPSDSDVAVAQATREAFLAALSDTPTLLIGTHFAGPTAGRVVRDGDAFRLDG